MIDLLVTNEHPVMSTELMTLVDYEIKNPITGAQKTYVHAVMKDVVKVIAKTGEDQIVMVKQWRLGGRTHYIELPGGMIEEGETVNEAGARELLEETGYGPTETAKIHDLGYVYANPGVQSNKIFYIYIDKVVKITDDTKDLKSFNPIYPVVMTREVLRDYMDRNKIESAHTLLGLLKVF